MSSFWDKFGDDSDDEATEGGESRGLELWHDDASDLSPEEETASSPEAATSSEQPYAASPARKPDAVDAVIAEDAPKEAPKLPGKVSGGGNNRRKVIYGTLLVLLFLFGLLLAFGGSSKNTNGGTTAVGGGSTVNPPTTYAVTVVPSTNSQTGTATVGNNTSEAKVIVQQAGSFLVRYDRIHGGLPSSDAKLTKLLHQAVDVPVTSSTSAKAGVLSFSRIQTNNEILLFMTDPKTQLPAFLTVHLPR